MAESLATEFKIPRLKDPAITIDGVDFQAAPPPAKWDSYKTIKVADGVTCIAGHHCSFGADLDKKAAAQFIAGLKSQAAYNKRYPTNAYSYTPPFPIHRSREGYEAELDKTLKGVKGLIVATTPTYDSQIRGATLLRLRGFKRVGFCSHNPNHDMTQHWIHLWYKFVEGVKEAGDYNPGHTDNLLNCCGANAYDMTERKTGTWDPNRLALMLYDLKKKRPKGAVTIHAFEDKRVLVVPGVTSQKCPHKFTLKGAAKAKEDGELDYEDDGYDEVDDYFEDPEPGVGSEIF